MAIARQTWPDFWQNGWIPDLLVVLMLNVWTDITAILATVTVQYDSNGYYCPWLHSSVNQCWTDTQAATHGIIISQNDCRHCHFQSLQRLELELFVFLSCFARCFLLLLLFPLLLHQHINEKTFHYIHQPYQCSSSFEYISFSAFITGRREIMKLCPVYNRAWQVDKLTINHVTNH